MAAGVASSDVVIGSSAALIVSANLTNTLTLMKATAVNYDTVTRYLTIYRVLPGLSAANSNMIIDALPIAPAATQVLPLAGQARANGQSLQAKADSASVVNVNLSYYASA